MKKKEEKEPKKRASKYEAKLKTDVSLEGMLKMALKPKAKKK
jgi:hypothetical protein